MTKFRYSDWSDIKTGISNSRIEILETLNKYQQAVDKFSNETELQGESWNAAKQHFELTLSITNGLKNALIDVGSMIDNYLGDFEGSVGHTDKDLDSDKLQSLQDDLNKLKAIRKAAVDATSKYHINNNLPGGTSNPYGSTGGSTFSSNIAGDASQIKLLELYEAFENRHLNDYGDIKSALNDIKMGIKELKNSKNFDAKTGMFNNVKITSEDWYENLSSYNSVVRNPAIDVKTIETPIYGAAGNVVGYTKSYEVYIDGKLNESAGKKLFELKEKEGLKFVSGILGVTDFLEAISGKDPFTGKKISSQERAKAIFWTLLIVLPIGEISRTIKGVGSGLKFSEESLRSSAPVVKTVSDIQKVKPLLKTESGTAFFWSGKTGGFGGDIFARKISETRGGVTLESTIQSRGIELPAWQFSNPKISEIWNLISKSYAEQASGEIRAVIGKNLRDGNIWETMELPILKNNPNVTKITVIDPITKQEKVVFER